MTSSEDVESEVRENLRAPSPYRRLWAITSYFDPCGSRSRLRAYREFRRHLQIPLIAVELVYEGEFHLRRQDADILIQLRGGSVLWQKERLLNIALQALPDECEAVAWVDCDFVFLRPDWPEAALLALEQAVLVQPFRRMHSLSKDVRPEDLDETGCTKVDESVAFLWVHRLLPGEVFRTCGSSGELRYVPGGAWVAKRELLAGHGLYDASVIGSGDKLLLAAACGRYEENAEAFHMNAQQRKHYCRWASAFHEAVQGRIGYVDGHVCHLWHDEVLRRARGRQYERFETFAFDPHRDLTITSDGVWRWNTDKSEMQDYVSRYFAWRASGDDA